MASISDTLCQNTRCQTAEMLKRNLLAAVDVRREIDDAHRNAGCEHDAIHELFDQVAEAVAVYAGMMSKCSAAFGAAEWASRAVRECSFRERHKPAIGDIEAQFAAVTAALAAFGQTARQAGDEAAAFGDANASNLCNAVTRGIDYHLWLVESHGQLLRPALMAA